MQLISDLIIAEKKYMCSLERCQIQGAEIFKETRKRFGWSQRELAALLGCNHTYLSKIENGHLKPGILILIKLGKLINQQEQVI
jgi:DNA-binding XRE family transcriptional regulator